MEVTASQSDAASIRSSPAQSPSQTALPDLASHQQAACSVGRDAPGAPQLPGSVTPQDAQALLGAATLQTARTEGSSIDTAAAAPAVQHQTPNSNSANASAQGALGSGQAPDARNDGGAYAAGDECGASAAGQPQADGGASTETAAPSALQCRPQESLPEQAVSVPDDPHETAAAGAVCGRDDVDPANACTASVPVREIQESSSIAVAPSQEPAGGRASSMREQTTAKALHAAGDGRQELSSTQQASHAAGPRDLHAEVRFSPGSQTAAQGRTEVQRLPKSGAPGSPASGQLRPGAIGQENAALGEGAARAVADNEAAMNAAGGLDAAVAEAVHQNSAVLGLSRGRESKGAVLSTGASLDDTVTEADDTAEGRDAGERAAPTDAVAASQAVARRCIVGVQVARNNAAGASTTVNSSDVVSRRAGGAQTAAPASVRAAKDALTDLSTRVGARLTPASGADGQDAAEGAAPTEVFLQRQVREAVLRNEAVLKAGAPGLEAAVRSEVARSAALLGVDQPWSRGAGIEGAMMRLNFSKYTRATACVTTMKRSQRVRRVLSPRARAEVHRQ
jgi:hypothetical protein